MSEPSIKPDLTFSFDRKKITELIRKRGVVDDFNQNLDTVFSYRFNHDIITWNGLIKEVEGHWGMTIPSKSFSYWYSLNDSALTFCMPLGRRKTSDDILIDNAFNVIKHYCQYKDTGGKKITNQWELDYQNKRNARNGKPKINKGGFKGSLGGIPTAHENMFEILRPNYSKQVHFGTGIGGVKEYGTNKYTVDFLSNSEIKTIYEIDGGSHNAVDAQNKDSIRDLFFEKSGFRVHRLTNQDVEKMMIDFIKHILTIHREHEDSYSQAEYQFRRWVNQFVIENSPNRIF